MNLPDAMTPAAIFFPALITIKQYENKKNRLNSQLTCKPVFCSGRRTRTSGLRVMSPTSYQLLYPAMLDYKGSTIF